MRDESGQFPGPVPPPDGQPRIAGYRPQSEDNVFLVNHHKQMEELVLRQLDDLDDAGRFDRRWLAIARTQIEQGFMAMNRAVMRPERITLAGDEKAEG